MNEFTKEELINIYIAACYELHHGCPPIELEHVKDKIQSMIDNYCEHKERIQDSDEDGHLLVKCVKCDLVFWHEQD